MLKSLRWQGKFLIEISACVWYIMCKLSDLDCLWTQFGGRSWGRKSMWSRFYIIPLLLFHFFFLFAPKLFDFLIYGSFYFQRWVAARRQTCICGTQLQFLNLPNAFIVTLSEVNLRCPKVLLSMWANYDQSCSISLPCLPHSFQRGSEDK